MKPLYDVKYMYIFKLNGGGFMNVFTTDKIRNVVLLGHGGCGKTSLVEAVAYLSGMTKRMGTIDGGNTISDYDKEEIKRKNSLKTSVVPIVWEGYKVNLLGGSRRSGIGCGCCDYRHIR